MLFFFIVYIIFIQMLYKTHHKDVNKQRRELYSGPCIKANSTGTFEVYVLFLQHTSQIYGLFVCCKTYIVSPEAVSKWDSM